MRPPAAKDVATYLANLPPVQRKPLTALRKVIRAALPKAQERISYGIPGYYQRGPVVFFAAFTKHLSFFAVNRADQRALAKELVKFEVRGSTIRFSPEKPLPASLVKKIIRLRLARNLERATHKKRS